MTARRRRRTLRIVDNDPHGQRITEGGGAVPLYVIERNFAEQLNEEEIDEAGIKVVNDDTGIRWVYSFLSADKKKTYCLYEAPNPEAIREAAERLGIPADEIVEVDQYVPAATA
jgi:hypothetical protein